MASLPRFELFPERISKDYPDVLVLLSEPINEQDLTICVQVPGKSSEKICTTMRDDRTYMFTVPDSYYFQDKLMVYVQYKNEFIGAGNLTVEKVQERLARILEAVVDPVELLLAALGLSFGEETNRDALDSDLANVVEKNIPPENLNMLFKKYTKIDGDPEDYLSDCRFPTALHFAAYYGFSKLTSTLLKCVGSSSARLLMNCDGQTPTEVAQCREHHSVHSLLSTEYVEPSEEPDYADPVELMKSCTDTSEEYMSMGAFRSSAGDSTPNSLTSPIGPRLPNTPIPHRPRTSSFSQLQVIKEQEANEQRVRSSNESPANMAYRTDKQESGYYEGDQRDSRTSLDSMDSGGSRPNSWENEKKTRKADISRSKVITKNTPPKNRLPPTDPNGSIVPYQRNKRPSLPNIWNPSEPPPLMPPVSQMQGLPPPPCPGATYMNVPELPRAPRPRKMSLPVGLDMSELINHQMFQKVKQSSES